MNIETTRRSHAFRSTKYETAEDREVCDFDNKPLMRSTDVIIIVLHGTTGYIISRRCRYSERNILHVVNMWLIKGMCPPQRLA